MNDQIVDARKQVWKELLDERDLNQQWLERRSFELDYFGLYLGDEMNTFHADWDEAIRKGRIDSTWRIVLMNVIASKCTFSAPAILLFYEQLHAFDPSWVVERSLCPPTARNQWLMRQDHVRPFAVESKMPLRAFDVLCLSIDLTGSAAAIPWALMESGIPVRARDRAESDPFVILGGSALVNPGPFAPLCDILFFGEGEEALPELLKMLEQGRRNSLSREELLLEAAKAWDCLYVPRFYEERYDADGNLLGTHPLRPDVPRRVHFHRVQDLDTVFIPTRPFLNFATYAPDTSNFEISRGCEGKCSFCMPGFTTLPFRARDAKLVLECTERIKYETGNTLVTPVAFSTVSHPQVNEIIRDISASSGGVKLISQRLDDFRANPEYCCFMSMQRRGRIVFGVEGASQRLRNYVSKNLFEEDILDLMSDVCRNGYRIVKFMMICNLPGETAEDLEELYGLAVKIRDIFDRETPAGAVRPRLVITWTTLKICPHTPLQWARSGLSLLPAYADLTTRIKELGFFTFTPQIGTQDIMDELFLRGDERLADLLVYLAREGYLKHDESHGDELLGKVDRFLEENGLPSVEEWFREHQWEDAFPWDIVEGPASKEYLYRRYRAMQEELPPNFPVCSQGCSGCGACSAQQREKIEALPKRRAQDTKIDLHHPFGTTPFVSAQHVLVEFEHDFAHSFVNPSYWDCELRRALYHAHVSFDPESVRCIGSNGYADYAASGPNVTSIALGRRYDIDDLRRRIQEHAVNLRVRSVTETERPVRVRTATYRMSLPEGVDDREASELLEERLAQSVWRVPRSKSEDGSYLSMDVRHGVTDLRAQDGDLLLTLDPSYAYPRTIYRYLFDLPVDEPLRQMPQRIGFAYENKGVLDLAMTREKREAFLQYRGLKEGAHDREYDDMAAYITSMRCVRDLENLIRRKYSMQPPYHYRVPKNFSGRKRDIYAWKGSVKYLLKLIMFVLRDYDHLYPEGLYSFRTSVTAQDFLLKLRNCEHIKDCWIVKADVSNYVSSIVPEKIIPQLEVLWKDDPALLDLMKYLLLRREVIDADGNVVPHEPGGLGGVPLANHFMNVYLMELDRYFMPRAPLYCRYSDDIVILAHSREEAEGYLAFLYGVLEDKGLTTNPEKTYLIAPGQEVEILGCKLKEGKMDLSDHALVKIKRKVRMRANYLVKAKKTMGLTDEEAARRLIAYCDSIFFGAKSKRDLSWARWLFPVITDVSNLKVIDRYVQDAIRYVICGSLAKKRYRVTYQDLKRLGYQSVVHAYYHFTRV